MKKYLFIIFVLLVSASILSSDGFARTYSRADGLRSAGKQTRVSRPQRKKLKPVTVCVCDESSKPGTVYVVVSGKQQSWNDECAGTGQVKEYSCLSPDACVASSITLDCPAGTFCQRGSASDFCIEKDSDDDGIGDFTDNCKLVSNPDQKDVDGDGIGDACDAEICVEEVCDGKDNDCDHDVDEYLKRPCQNECGAATESCNYGAWTGCPAPDADGDAVVDCKDNCVGKKNPNQMDTDSDGLGDVCDEDLDGDNVHNEDDSCPNISNPMQEDDDLDGIGNACDYDSDNDGVVDDNDNCLEISNEDQADSDGDGIGDVCDNCPKLVNKYQKDSDSDGVGDVCDNCKVISNPDQKNLDSDIFGDACDYCPVNASSYQTDTDGDGVDDACDNCPEVKNLDQSDEDNNGFGDVCDSCSTDQSQIDNDGDGVVNQCDNCPNVANPDQLNTDKDRVGDVCDNCPTLMNRDQTDSDGDGIGDKCDNCPKVKNTDQKDTFGDSAGDACEMAEAKGIISGDVLISTEGYGNYFVQNELMVFSDDGVFKGSVLHNMVIRGLKLSKAYPGGDKYIDIATITPEMEIKIYQAGPINYPENFIQNLISINNSTFGFDANTGINGFSSEYMWKRYVGDYNGNKIRMFMNNVELPNCVINLGNEYPAAIFTGTEFGNYSAIVGWNGPFPGTKWGILRFPHSCVNENSSAPKWENIYTDPVNTAGQGVLDIMEVRSVPEPGVDSWSGSIFIRSYSGLMQSIGSEWVVYDNNSNTWLLKPTPFKDVAVNVTQNGKGDIITVERPKDQNDTKYYLRRYSPELINGTHYRGTIYTDEDGEFLKDAMYMIVMP